MTVGSEASYSDHSWTGVETTFAGGFKAQAAAHVAADYIDSASVETALTNGVHFSATIDGDGNVTVTPIALPAAPGTLRIKRQTPALQQTNFVNLGAYSATIHEQLHDAAAYRAAEARRDVALVAASAIERGWTPTLALEADGSRIVQKVADWTGGTGTKPATGLYVGTAGLEAAIGDGVDVRGSAGAGTGDVVGPSGGTAAGQPALYADGTGKLLQAAATLTPAQLTASVADYAPTGHATAYLFRLSADAAWSLTGLAGGAANRTVRLVNVGAFAITLENEDASSTAANRFALAGDVELAAGEGIDLVYDTTSSRWRAAAATPDDAIRTRHLAAGAVDETALGDGSVTPAKLGGGVSAGTNVFMWENYR